MKMTCTVCPTGCEMTVTIEDGIPVEVTGNLCKRGLAYAQAECVNPVRTLTTTVRLCNSNKPLLPVRTDKAVPKSQLKEMVQVLNGLAVSAPVQTGDILLENILNSGANVIATGDAVLG